ncbi:hypothetical protein Ahy_B10g105326 [Arachis hypogaea]|uniref:HMA domain-containing protein n=1 Tax=Arachis hypogaea TaxID=3818 RepID=A0A444X7Q4_ARAHY|nr:hypothetical protein Ahy_B10g105326 [Arachis hypogaea]
MCRVANKNVTNLAGPLQLLQSWIFWWFPMLDQQQEYPAYGKVTVSGNVDLNVLIKNLSKSGKYAELCAAPKPNNNQNQNSHLSNHFNKMQIDTKGGRGGNNNKGQQNQKSGGNNQHPPKVQW